MNGKHKRSSFKEKSGRRFLPSGFDPVGLGELDDFGDRDGGSLSQEQVDVHVGVPQQAISLTSVNFTPSSRSSQAVGPRDPRLSRRENDFR